MEKSNAKTKNCFLLTCVEKSNGKLGRKVKVKLEKESACSLQSNSSYPNGLLLLSGLVRRPSHGEEEDPLLQPCVPPFNAAPCELPTKTFSQTSSLLVSAATPPSLFLMDIITVLFHLALLLSLPTVSIALIKRSIQTDQSALFALKSQLFDSKNLLRTNWTANVSVCNWFGVTCFSRHHRVVSLNLSYLGLQGSIPPDIGNLSFLSSIDLSGNNFHGNLPMEEGMVHLRRLRYISLANNNFGGEVPPWFGSLPNLRVLDLSSNSFVGGIPISLFNASKLESISIMFNQVQGNIPREIGNLGNLKILRMANNQLTGFIPLTLFNISSLQIVKYCHGSTIARNFENCH
nr:receptor-like protein 33 [Coffea arabica]